ncbi:MAG: rhamnulokinase, partial [Paramuribaculum sp.]|nr:rhamnulokinase [Paramuribaculum sp.]
LALRYRQVMGMLVRFSPVAIRCLHIIGGGSRNDRLNKMTADALGMPVIVGPVECTAMGNVMLQAKAAGIVDSTEEMRRVIRNSTDIKEYKPDISNKEKWDEAYRYFLTITK